MTETAPQLREQVRTPGALSRSEYLDGLATAGFTDASVTFTHEVAPGLHAAFVRATQPAPAASR